MPKKIIFLPSAWSDEFVFSKQIEVLQNHYEIITPNIHQFDTIDQATAFLLANYYDVYAMVGLSLGGLIAIDLLSKQPSFAKKLILSGTFAHAISDNDRPIYENLIAEVANGKLSHYTQFFADVVTASSTKANISLMAQIQTMVNRVGAQTCMNHHKMALSYIDHTTVLKNITTETFIIVGAEDEATPLAVQKVLRDGIPQSRLEIIPAGGHFVPLEQPEMFNRLLLQCFEV